MSSKYTFGWNDAAAVECSAMDTFIKDLMAVCEKHGIGFEMDSYSEGGGYLVPVPYASGDYAMFFDHLDEYRGGIFWLDEAKARYEALRQQQSEEYDRQHEVKREADDRANYERLKQKYG